MFPLESEGQPAIMHRMIRFRLAYLISDSCPRTPGRPVQLEASYVGRKSANPPFPDAVTLEGALAALGAEELRELVHELLDSLENRARDRIVDGLIARACRVDSGLALDAPSPKVVSEVLTFAAEALEDGYADPGKVDSCLREGSRAFLARDYFVAHEIFKALLPPVAEMEIDLGQHEMVDEVLSVSVSDCAAQYVVSAYVTSDPDRRGKAVWSAIQQVQGIGYFRDPISRLEEVAVEPLPELNEFLLQWKVLLECEAGSKPPSDWDRDVDRWLREAIGRTEGAEGLARIARRTKSASSLRAWCEILVESGNWQAALGAFEEAAEIIGANPSSKGEFLDGAALAVQELGRDDLLARLGLAWRTSPDMARLRRWLGATGNEATIRERAAEALEACPKSAGRQRAFLHVLCGQFVPAAKILSGAPGLGWSGTEHPGHLLFPLLARLFEAEGAPGSSGDRSGAGFDTRDTGEVEPTVSGSGGPNLATPSVGRILELAGVGAPRKAAERAALLDALREAADKRVAGVTGQQRRRHYGHAAELVATCAKVAPTPETASWVDGIRGRYRRYSAFQAELDARLRKPGTRSKR